MITAPPIEGTTLDALGLGFPALWLTTVGLAIAWLALMWAYTPVADRLATKCVVKPPNLDFFRKLQQSRFNLAIGLLLAWVIGAFAEEVALRGLVLRWIEMLASPWMAWPLPSALAVCVAAMAAGIAHLYQGLRAAIIIFQLSVMFGILFVIDSYHLWSVIFCHGLMTRSRSFDLPTDHRSIRCQIQDDRQHRPGRALPPARTALVIIASRSLLEVAAWAL
jgi:hypothetical protein